MNRSASLSRLFAALSCLAFFAAVHAEEPRTFVVTASRVEEDVLETPSQVVVVTSEQIAASGAATVVEALEKLAGVQFRSYSGEAQSEISLRGFGENSHGRALVLMDGRRLNNPDMQTINWLAIPLADIERIEVLQGASSVRYGNNAVGGVVNIITKRAKLGTRAFAGFSVGSFGENRQQLGVNVGGESAGLVASAERYDSDGYRDRSGYGTTNASARGHFDPADLLRLKGGISYGASSYEMPGDLTKAQFKDDPTQAGNPSDESKDWTFLSELGAEWSPDETLFIDVPLGYSIKNIESDMASWFSYTDRQVQNLQASPSASWETELGELPLRLVAGADLSAAFLDVKNYSDKARTTQTNSFEVSQVSVGPFLTARLGLRDDLALEGGARYDRSTIAGTNVDGSVDDSKTHEAFVYDAGIVYRPGRDAKVFVRYGTLFRYPFTDEQTSFYGYGSDVFLTGLDAEKGFNLEAGASAALGKFLRADLVGYWMELRDEIAWFPTGPFTGYNDNLDKTRRLGADMTVEATPAEYLSLKGNYGYVDAAFANGANDGNRVPLVSAHRVDVQIEFRSPIGLSMSPGVSFRSDAYQGGDNANAQEKIDPYAVYALTFRLAPTAFKGALDIVVKAENLLDNQYAPYVLYSSFSGISGYYPAAGRSLSVGATYRY